jgi:hypothetical protein
MKNNSDNKKTETSNYNYEYHTGISDIKFLFISSLVAMTFAVVGFLIFNQSQKTTNVIDDKPSISYRKSPESIINKTPDIPTMKTPITSQTELNNQQIALPSLPIPDNNNRINFQKTFIYTPDRPPNFKRNDQLQSIIKNVTDYVAENNLPTEKLSISLIDFKTNSSENYQGNIGRFPASVVKLFWLVALYGYVNYHQGDIGEYTIEIQEMIGKSDNEESSNIVDAITGAKSNHKNMSQSDYQEWLKKRNLLNQYFVDAGYNGININQKTYPIPSKKMFKPQGADLKMRGNDPKNPIRNKITTEQAARLMYEIITGQAISPESSQEMRYYLNRINMMQDGSWKNIDPNQGQGHFNPIKGFFGEYFANSDPKNIQEFASKAGWTSDSRSEVAYINDGQVAYILAVFTQDAAYAQNWQIFPKISELVYQKMQQMDSKYNTP